MCGKVPSFEQQRKVDDDPPVCALQTCKGNVTALASEEIIKGCLAIPVFCIRDNSHLTPGCSNKLSRGHHEVIGRIKWKVPGDDIVRGVEREI